MQEDKQKGNNVGKEFVQDVPHDAAPESQPRPEPLIIQAAQPPAPGVNVEPPKVELPTEPVVEQAQPQTTQPPTAPINSQENLPPTNTGVYTDDYVDAQVNKDQLSTTKRKKILKLSMLVLFIAILFVVGIVGFKAFGNTSSTYERQTLSNNGNYYSFLFDKNAGKESSSGYNELTGYNLSGTNKLTVAILKSPYSSNCAAKYSLLLVDFSFSFQGKHYPACAVSNRDTIIANFEYKNVWQYAEIYSNDSKTGIDSKTASNILGSIKVN